MAFGSQLNNKKNPLGIKKENEGHQLITLDLWSETERFTNKNKYVSYNKTTFRIMENGTLWIEKSESSHEGHYLCKADNGVVHGSSLSKLAEISVNGEHPLENKN